jgi:hypothetical protein
MEATKRKRVKTVFGTNEVPHLWANQSVDYARNAQGNLYFRGDTIYSYGSHFPMARLIGGNRVLVSTRGYSSTTAGHLSSVRSAVRHMDILLVHNVMADGVDSHLTNVSKMIETIEELAGKMSRARQNKDYYKSEIVKVQLTLKQYVEIMDIEKHLDAVQLEFLKDSYFDVESPEYVSTLSDRVTRRAEAIIARDKIRKEQEKKEAKKSLKRWLNGEYVGSRIFDVLQTGPMLRLSGDMVETSMGAKVPVAEARLLAKVVDKVEQSKENLKPEDMRIGHYTINLITTTGDIVAGCHKIKAKEIKRFRKVMGW